MKKTVGILGAGQLAQLLAIAAYQLGFKTLCYAEHQDCPAARVSPVFYGKLDDKARLLTFAQQVDVITLETENIPDNSLDILNTICEVLPGKMALQTAQDRLLEKQLFNELTIPTVAFKAIDHYHDMQDFSYPAILKTRTLGYDGKGQCRMDDNSQAEAGWQSIDQRPAILEQQLDFDGEVSQIATRNHAGKMIFYPLIANHHEAGILRTSTYPAANQDLAPQAQDYCEKILQHFDYIGTLALELFVKDQQLFANEIAPRVHNSGHLTIEATNCSQFENHLRAVGGLPLIEPTLHIPVQMHNIIGQWPKPEQFKDAWHIYDYGKTERPNRKLGHWVKRMGSL